MEQNYKSEPVTKEDFLSQGVKCYREKRYDEALLAYEQAIQIDPSYALAFYGKGLALSQLRSYEYEEALLAYDRSVQLNSSYFRSHKGKGDILYKLGRYDEALASYEEAIRLNPRHAQSYYAKGHTLYCLKENDATFAAFDHAIELDPGNAYYYEYKAYLLAYEGFVDEALRVYDKLFSVKPEHIESYIEKAEVYRYFTDNHIGALDAYNQAIFIDRKFVKAYQYKAALLFDDKLYGLAADVYDSIIQLVPDDRSAYFWRGTCLLEVHRYEEALADFERVIQLDAPKSDAIALYSRGKALCGCNRYNEALAEIKNAMQFEKCSYVDDSVYYRSHFSYQEGTPHTWLDYISYKMHKLLSELENSQDSHLDLENNDDQWPARFNGLFTGELEEHELDDFNLYLMLM